MLELTFMVGFGGENTLSVVEVDSKFDNEGSEIVLFLLNGESEFRISSFKSCARFSMLELNDLIRSVFDREFALRLELALVPNIFFSLICFY